MLESAQNTLQNTFGYSQFREPQDQIITSVLKGHDTMVIMPTGGGKSLCYQIPAIVLAGTGIVISPLIALMQNQVDALELLGVNAAFLNSSLSSHQAREVEASLMSGELDLLYVAPERFNMPNFQAMISRCQISLIAVDEAHCVSQWGHDFRTDYLYLEQQLNNFPNTPKIALTATADASSRDEILNRLGLQQPDQYICGFDRPNIQYRIEQKKDGRQQLLRFLSNEHAEDAGIVYCLSRRKVEDTAAWLCDRGFTALPYHAGLSTQVRAENQSRFLKEEKVIVVATIAFGMGIDKPDVRFVAHLDLPKSLEAYYQETGRGGRDGAPATAWMIYGLQDVIKLRQMAESSNGSETFKRHERHRLDTMLGLCEVISCRRQVLLSYFGELDSQACGNCDNCLAPPETWDGTDASRKALSCVFRSGQRFGVNHLIDVLLGKHTEKIKQFGHEQLSTFNIGSELDTNQWRSVFRQLVAQGMLSVDVGGFGGLRLAEKCRPLLQGQESISLRKEVKQTSSKKSRSNDVREKDRELWDILRALRKDLAASQDIPPYMIFHDATLMEMIRWQPQTADELSRISGVGSSKLENYGQTFLSCLNDYYQTQTGSQDNSADRETLMQTLSCFKDGLSPDDIAKQRSLKPTTVYNHLEKLIEQGQLLLGEVLDLDASEISAIEVQLMEQKEANDRFVLKPVFECFDGNYSYEQLRCVRAALVLKIEQ